ncbi:hypothetical protein [Azotobacter chroococcum]|nr:hypothetical protein [Azotobacter chroococcum]
MSEIAPNYRHEPNRVINLAHGSKFMNVYLLADIETISPRPILGGFTAN